MYLGIVTAFIAVGPWVLKSDWLSSSDFHSCIEITGSLIALVAGVTCLMYFFGLKNRYYLVVGLGFFISGSEDLAHGVLSFSRLFKDSGVDFTRFIPGTYVSGRIILASMTIAAPLLERTLGESKNVKREAFIYSDIAILVGGSLTALAFAIPLPKFIFPERFIARPVDLYSAVLFLMAFLLVWKRYRVSKDVFSAMLLASILFNMGGQIYMSFSKRLFDAPFDFAHMANVLSYLMPLLGIALQGLEEMRKSQAELCKGLEREKHLKITQFSVDKAPEMIMWVEVDLQIHYVNMATCSILGYEQEEMVDQPLWHFCPEWSEKQCLDESNLAISTGLLSFDVDFHHKDGTVIPIAVRISKLEYDRAQVFLCISGRDLRERRRTITALKEARAKAEVATRAKSEFLATMSHEIRTPLTAILGYSDALHQFGDLQQAPTKRINMLSAIKRNGSHLLDLINDILDLSQIEAGQVDLSLTPDSPFALVQEVTANLLERAQVQGVVLKVDCTTPIPRQIQIDPKRFRQVLTNLIGNAIKFTDKGHITVRLSVQDSNSESPFLVVEVEDTGIGIPAEKQAVIFDPFTQGHDQQVRNTKGTGLGLSICRRLVLAGGGEIGLQSKVGQGSVFTFTVPFTPTSDLWQPKDINRLDQQKTCLQQEMPKVNLTGTRILVVEDTPDTQDLLTLFLENADATVSVASTGIDGVTAAVEAMYAGSPYDLILMDMRLPGLTGPDATRRLRSAGIHCPIIALTAYAMKGDEQACLDSGCNAYVTKPIDLHVLFKIIEQQLPTSQSTLSLEPELDILVSEKINDLQFEPLIKKYLSRLPEVLDELQAARKEEECDTLCAIVHRLRGTATNYGFPQITAVAGKCENALRTQPNSLQHLDESLDLLANLVRMAIETDNNSE